MSDLSTLGGLLVVIVVAIFAFILGHKVRKFIKKLNEFGSNVQRMHDNLRYKWKKKLSDKYEEKDKDKEE